MFTAHTSRSRRMRCIAALGGVAALALTLTACSADAESSGDVGGTDAANSELAQTVKELTQELDHYPVPTDPVDGVADLNGATVYYIPVTQRAPQFAVTQAGLEAAAKTAGVKVQACDGQGTPTAISACISQATKANAAGIILDGFSYDMAANAIDSAQSAGVPVVISNQLADDDHPTSDTFSYVGTAGTPQMTALAQWITLDSGGSANVLINESTDGESQIAYVEAGIKQFETDCPECVVEVNKISSANFQEIPSSTSSALLKNPDTDYLIVEFAEYLQPTQKGVQQSSNTGLNVVAGASALSTLKLVESGGIKAATAQAAGYQGWVDLDAIFRLVEGQDVPEYEIPSRLFTPETIGDIDLTQAAEQSGEWFGPTTFTDDFASLWGLD
ncbi:sugar ABC transporter substrate-binding protein [Paramicrobacterium chengjingii]|uniref:sugar ABC transporter substrate-binding protein n=1 Tax=Paramicrobacterium chengjingii TaxID=2769067 RepID=UPI001421B781|nr:substrate-binding domain-containing protein [Microbacterium chengjingii]